MFLLLSYEWLSNGSRLPNAHPKPNDTIVQNALARSEAVPDLLREMVDSIKVAAARRVPRTVTIPAPSSGADIEPPLREGSEPSVVEEVLTLYASSEQLPEHAVINALLKREGLRPLEQTEPKRAIPPLTRVEKARYNVVELTDTKPPSRVQNAFWWSPFSTSITLPAAIQTRITPKIFAGISLGNDEYGYIWGAGGVGRLTAGTQSTKMYVVFPVNGIYSRQLDGMYGLGFSVDLDSFGGGLQFQKAEPKADQQSKQAGLYAYYSKTIDISSIFSDADLRWKVGPAFMDLRSGTDTSTLSLPYNRKTHQTMFLLYTKVEVVAGDMDPYPLTRYEMSLQSMIGTRKYFALTFAYNFNVWLGAEIMLASVLPGDLWNNDFVIVVGPKFRL